jgi:hypothetical protein
MFVSIRTWGSLDRGGTEWAGLDTSWGLVTGNEGSVVALLTPVELGPSELRASSLLVGDDLRFSEPDPACVSSNAFCASSEDSSTIRWHARLASGWSRMISWADWIVFSFNWRTMFSSKATRSFRALAFSSFLFRNACCALRTRARRFYVL